MIDEIERGKIDKAKYSEFLVGLEVKLGDIDSDIVDHGNKIITMENYAEKYIPIKI